MLSLGKIILSLLIVNISLDYYTLKIESDLISLSGNVSVVLSCI